MKIRSKVLLAFSLVFLTILFLFSNSISTIKKMNTSVDEIVNVQYGKVELATTLRNEVSSISRIIRNYVISDSDEVRNTSSAQITQSRANGEKALMDLDLPAGVDIEIKL